MKIDVIIPVEKCGNLLGNVVKRLLKQTVDVNRIYMIKLNKRILNEKLESLSDKVRVIDTPSNQYEGVYKNAAMAASDADIVCFISSEAKAYNEYMLANLIAPLTKSAGICFSYGRHLAKGNCQEVERVALVYNYPSKSRVISQENPDNTGLGAYMFSDVCSAYLKSEFDKQGGFDEDIPYGTDKLFAAKVISSGGKIAYCASSVVLYSNNYSFAEQFKRFFDAGALQKDRLKDLGYSDSIKSEAKLGTKSILGLMDYHEYLWLGYIFLYNSAKYAGYLVGTQHKLIPNYIKKKISAHPERYDA
ncbi:MAG: glycosyltransferase [Lachnospiraceae bacterium]|nr:glycosyltransferase [Lachnospiraceae bacterium]